MKVLGQFLLFHALICAASHVQGIIINEEFPPEGSMQFMVSVQTENGHVCGGFLISEDFVVTAAQCDSGLKHVILGGHNWRNSTVKKIKISNQYKHQKYSDVHFGYDIMLLKLANKAPMGENIKTIPLAEKNMNLSANQECSFAGWGKTESTCGLVDDLRVVSVPIIDHNDCRQSWGGLPPNVICAGGKYTDKGFCQGDGGGPLVCNGKAVGIASFNKNCKHPDVPNVYTDIREYVEWINNQGQRTKDRRHTTKDQGPTINDQRPTTKVQGPVTKDQGPRTKDQGATTHKQGPRTKDQGATTHNQGPRTKDQRPRTNHQGPRTNHQRPRTNDQGPTTNDQRPTTKDQQHTTKDQGPMNKDQGPRTNDQRPRNNIRSLESPTTVRGFIINGDLAPEGSMQFMVSVQNKNGHVCGGFLISEDFVVTAAHCDSGLKHVILGGHNWKNSNVKKIEISNQCKHKKYRAYSYAQYDYDIMLLKKYSDAQYGYDILVLILAEKAPMGDNIKTIPLAENDMNLSANQECSFAGWGRRTSTGGLADDLRVANVPIIDHNDCQQSWGSLPRNVICAGGKYTDKGFCQGDSGGPLVCNGKAVGIVSFNRNYNCKYPDVPNVYTDIREYVDWIKYITIVNTCPM